MKVIDFKLRAFMKMRLEKVMFVPVNNLCWDFVLRVINHPASNSNLLDGGDIVIGYRT